VFGAGGPPPPGLDPHQLSARGTQVGMLARKIATAEGWPRQAISDAFFAGLLHEVALPVLAGTHPGAWADLRHAAATHPGPDVERQLEVEHFGCATTEASAYLLGLWGFSEPVVEAIATQPSAPDDPAALPAALLLGYTRRQVLFPDSPPATCQAGYLTPDRLGSWQQIAGVTVVEPVDV
ncbi:MAG TPA: HDOD domain-containing protein, partial [Kineosporiaceae bacterium]|nr:HDOD domain-containing protein [Kineosporiaceae bacterium]